MPIKFLNENLKFRFFNENVNMFIILETYFLKMKFNRNKRFGFNQI